MSAYLIFTRDKTLDKQELATYGKEAGPTLAGHEVKVLAFYGPHEDLEGAATEGTVILEFLRVFLASCIDVQDPFLMEKLLHAVRLIEWFIPSAEVRLKIDEFGLETRDDRTIELFKKGIDCLANEKNVTLSQ